MEGYPDRSADLDPRSVPEAHGQAPAHAGTGMAEGQELSHPISAVWRRSNNSRTAKSSKSACHPPEFLPQTRGQDTADCVLILFRASLAFIEYEYAYPLTIKFVLNLTK